ncbi:MAG: hypothetical protein IJM15_03675 [Erysipelotrichaceae bacterium]|nr:hypothetical protein [Erysipelotrichaceae bacterium]
MTGKEWLEEKGVDAVSEELQKIVSQIADDQVVVTIENEPFDDSVSFVFEFEDGSYVSEGPYLEDEEVEDDFDSTSLLKLIVDALYNDYIEMRGVIEYNNHQDNFNKKLFDWSDEN